MPRQAATSTGRRPRLNTERVLSAALLMADESGLDSLTMRRLGESLGVEAMALYNHVAGKDAILDGIVDLVMSEVEVPPPGEGWAEAVRRCALSAHEVLLRHPWACSLVMLPTTGGGAIDARMRYIEALLRTFRQAGFSAGLAFRAYHAVDSHVLGFTMWELGHTASGRVIPADLADRLMAQVSSGQFPYLLEHAHEHMADRAEEQSEFEFGLDLVLDGLRRLHAAEISAGEAAEG